MSQHVHVKTRKTVKGSGKLNPGLFPKPGFSPLQEELRIMTDQARVICSRLWPRRWVTGWELHQFVTEQGPMGFLGTKTFLCPPFLSFFLFFFFFFNIAECDIHTKSECMKYIYIQFKKWL